MRWFAFFLTITQIVTGIFLFNLYYPYKNVSFIKPSEIESQFYERYEKPATLDTVITEIQRASFCQNIVIPMSELWKDNKGKDRSVKERLGPELWKRCSNYVWSPVVLPVKK